MKLKRSWSILLLALVIPHNLEADLRISVSIGSNDLNYLFFAVSGAVFDDEFNIYVADSKGSFVRKYNKRGIFVREVGKHGQGPGDFSDGLSSMHILGQELYVLDAKNMRIVIMDLDLNIKEYVRIRRSAYGLLKINGLYYMLCLGSEDPFFRIIVFDNEGNFHKEFFDQRPSHLDKIPATRMEMAAMKIFTGMNFRFNKESGEIVVVPQNPGKTIEMFFYSPEGNLLRKLDVNHIVRYHFPFKLEWPLKYPERGEWINIRSIHWLSAGELLLEYYVVSYLGGKAERTEPYILVVNTNSGKLVHKEMIEPELNIMDAKDKTILARTVKGDIIKLVVCELEFK